MKVWQNWERITSVAGRTACHGRQANVQTVKRTNENQTGMAGRVAGREQEPSGSAVGKNFPPKAGRRELTMVNGNSSRNERQTGAEKVQLQLE